MPREVGSRRDGLDQDLVRRLQRLDAAAENPLPGIGLGRKWRAQQQLTTYDETSGSLLLHQSHVRQPGISDGSENPNWKRYQRRT